MKAPTSSNTHDHNSTNHSGMTFLGASVASLAYAANVAMVVFGLLAAISLGFSVYFNSWLTTARNIELEARFAPRKLMTEQRTRLVELLKAVPKGPLSIETVLGDAESAAFAGDFEAIFKAAGWTVEGGLMLTAFASRNPVGYGIVIRDKDNVPAHAGPLQKAFMDAGLSLTAELQPSLPIGMVRLVVGVRP